MIDAAENRETVTRRDTDVAMRAVLSLVGRRTWIEVGERRIADAARRQFLGEFILDRHRIELGVASLLGDWDRTHHVPKIPRTSDEAVGAEFILASAKIIRRASPEAKKRIRGMIRGALDSGEGLNSVSHEFSAAAECERRGWSVSYEDLENRAQFDFLATKGPNAIEVECKSISGDIGRKIHQRDFLQFAEIVDPIVTPMLTQPGFHLLAFDIFNRLPKDHRSHRALADGAVVAIQRGTTVTCRGLGDVSYSNKAIRSELGLPQTASELCHFIERTHPDVADALGRMTVAVASKAGSFVVLTMKSREPDKVVYGIYRQLKDKGANQFTRTRPAMLLVRLEAVSPEGLVRLASSASIDSQKASDFLKMTNSLMVKRPWLHTIGFVPQSRARSLERGVTTESVVYVFRNPDHAASVDSLDVFG
ncbi:MAG: hypothetical protein JSR47_07480 [Proteobacteria bacterium]|nr:hypothetical protein [Pseudomonadota bacterium]